MTNMTSTLLLTTALCLPTLAFAQSSDAPCTDLEILLNDGLPQALEGERDNLIAVVQNDDIAVCEAEFVRVQQIISTGDAETVQDGAQVADTEQTTLTLQDEVTVEGMVMLDQSPPQVDVTSGDTDVEIEPGSPSVTVSEGQGEIIVRQAPANVTIDMPMPTIRIEQAAPEIIITMPDPSVAVGAAQPQVRVVQSDPTISVTQSPPLVDLQLRRVEDGAESTGFQVTDNRSGTNYASGVAPEPITTEDADVNFTSGEPRVSLLEPTEPANVRIERAQPSIVFEQSEPQVTFTENGEPMIEFIQSGDPVVTFEEAASSQTDTTEMDDTQEASNLLETDEAETDMAETDMAETDMADTDMADTDMADTDMADTDMAETDLAETDMAETDMAETDLMDADAVETDAVETDMADADAVETTADVQMAGPQVEREGYNMAQFGDIQASELVGRNVYGVNDEDVGEVGSLVFNTEGVVTHVVIEVGGFLGLGEKNVAVAFEELSILTSNDGDMRVYVAASEEELEAMPEAEL